MGSEGAQQDFYLKKGLRACEGKQAWPLPWASGKRWFSEPAEKTGARSEAEGGGLGGVTEQDARRSDSGGGPACEVRRETKACVSDLLFWKPLAPGGMEGDPQGLPEFL